MGDSKGAAPPPGAEDEKEKQLSQQHMAMRERIAMLSRQKKNPMLVDPRTSKRLSYWDAFVGLLLVYTALLTPYEVAFLPVPSDARNARFILNRLVDLFFVVDMCVQLVVMYPEPPEAVSIDDRQTSLRRSGVLKPPQTTIAMVTSHRAIACHYFRGWFLVDLVSVLTLIIDVIPVSEAMRAAELSASDASLAQETDADDFGSLRIFRVLRVLRLIKLVRLLKTSRLLKRWQTAIAIDFSVQTMLWCLFSYLLAGHWFACILVGCTVFADTPLHTWRGAKGYCVASQDPSELHHSATWELQPLSNQVRLAYPYLADQEVYCVSPGDMWAATYYWMIQLISGAAGGDTNQTDMSAIEQILFTVLVVLSCLLMSQIIASFCDVLSNMNPENTAFRNRMDHLNRYCRANQLATVTRRELREYLIRAKHVQVGDSQRELVMLMSPKLQGELSLQINGPWLTSVQMLRRIEMGCIVRIALALVSRVYVPTELLNADSMYYLDRGSVVYRGNVLITGTVWGEDCVVSRIDMRSRPARALAYVEVAQLSGEEMTEIISTSQMVYDKEGNEMNYYMFPIAMRKLRWARVRLTLIHAARQTILSRSEGGMKHWDKALGQMEQDIGQVLVEGNDDQPPEKSASDSKKKPPPKQGPSFAPAPPRL